MNDVATAQREWTCVKIDKDFSGVVNNQGLAHIIATQLKFNFGEGIKGQPLNIINDSVVNLIGIDNKFARTMCEFFLMFDFVNTYLSDRELQTKVYHILQTI